MKRLLFFVLLCCAPVFTEKVATQTRTVTAQHKETTVYVTNTGKKYHLSHCQYLSKSKIAIKLSTARRSYDPCKVCRPPQ